MDSSTRKSAEDAKSMNDLFELVERKTIQLNEKDKELATYKQQNMVKEQQIKKLTTNLNLVTVRANEANELKTALATSESEKWEYRRTIQTYQTIFWKTFPSPHLCYYIKTTSGLPQKYHFLYADSSGQLRSSGNQPIQCSGHFKFTKSLDGSFVIYSVGKGKYMQPNSPSPTIFFSANDCSTIDTKFVLTFLLQNQHPGFMVDIRSLANDNFLSGFNVFAFLRVDSVTPPPNKFLIVPVVDGQ